MILILQKYFEANHYKYLNSLNALHATIPLQSIMVRWYLFIINCSIPVQSDLYVHVICG